MSNKQATARIVGALIGAALVLATIAITHIIYPTPTEYDYTEQFMQHVLDTRGTVAHDNAQEDIESVVAGPYMASMTLHMADDSALGEWTSFIREELPIVIYVKNN